MDYGFAGSGGGRRQCDCSGFFQRMNAVRKSQGLRNVPLLGVHMVLRSARPPYTPTPTGPAVVVQTGRRGARPAPGAVKTVTGGKTPKCVRVHGGPIPQGDRARAPTSEK
ncbi:hypothetical protein AAFF_G00008760 [Aldrovandia affinis]|uniref:Uncharacterized protein n=1 Tax=Aldrovandia affinis TaxID=143900 RepID=A0AAD7T6N8_9TELE|nr:hypothetical protein AAFF_G00008760 [Aldrovandia affinis]